LVATLKDKGEYDPALEEELKFAALVGGIILRSESEAVTII